MSWSFSLLVRSYRPFPFTEIVIKPIIILISPHIQIVTHISLFFGWLIPKVICFILVRHQSEKSCN